LKQQLRTPKKPSRGGIVQEELGGGDKFEWSTVRELSTHLIGLLELGKKSSLEVLTGRTTRQGTEGRTGEIGRPFFVKTKNL